MFGRWKQKSERVLLDADWLLGDSPSPAFSQKPDDKKPDAKKPDSKRGGILSTLLFMSLVAASVYLWPIASKSWLRWEWSKQIVQSTKKSSEDVLPILLALNDLSPDHSVAVVSQLASDNVDKRLVAYHLLQKRIDRWETEVKPSPSELAALAKSLDSMPSSNQDSVMLRAQIAARMLRFTGREADAPSALRTSLESMIAVAASKSSNNARDTNTTNTSSSNVATADPKLVDSPTLAMSKPAPIAETRVIRNRITDSPAQLEDTTPKLTTPENLSSPSAPRIAAKKMGSFETNGKTLAPWNTPIDPPVPTEPKSSANRLAESNVPRAPWRGSSVPPPLLETSQKIENTVEDLESKETPVAIQGMEKRPFEEILRLLASAQPKIAVSASNELLRRGMARPQLEIAVALAQGDAQARSEAMDQLVRDTSFDSVPWLVWMAEQADPKVRRKAIAMLGSMSSPEAMRKLRLLKQRESDSSIADQINQVLLAAGTPSNTIR